MSESLNETYGSDKPFNQMAQLNKFDSLTEQHGVTLNGKKPDEAVQQSAKYRINSAQSSHEIESESSVALQQQALDETVEVLIVNEDAFSVEFLTIMLKKQGYLIDMSTDG